MQRDNSALPMAWHQAVSTLLQHPGLPMTHKSDTVLCPMKKGHYLHSSTVCFNVNHISSLYSLFLQTFKNTGVQLKKKRVTHRTAMHIWLLSSTLWGASPWDIERPATARNIHQWGAWKPEHIRVGSRWSVQGEEERKWAHKSATGYQDTVVHLP